MASVLVEKNPSEYPFTGGFHPCLAWRYALLQAAHTFEQGASKEKQTHGEGHVSLTKVGNPSSPGSAESCRQMPVTKGEKTLQTCKDQKCFRSGNGPPASYGNWDAQTLSRITDLFLPFATL